LIIIYIAFISLGLPDPLLGATWPIMHQDFGVSLETVGILSMIVSCGTIVSSFFSGKILHRFGTGKVTFVSILMTACALLGISYAPSFVWLLLLAIPLGLGAGSVDAGLNSYIAAHYKSHHMSWLHCFWGVGAMTGPIIMSQYVMQGHSWRMGYVTIASIQFILVLFIFLALPLWSRTEKTLQIQYHEPMSSEDPNSDSSEDKLEPILSLRGVKSVLLSFFLYCAIESTIGLWGSSFLVEVKGIDATIAAGWIALFFGGITLGRFINGFLTLKLSNKALIRMGESIILIGILLILLPLPNLFLICGFILAGLGCAPIYPCMLHDTPARYGKKNAQRLMGIQMAVAYSSFTFLPPIFGFVASKASMAIYPFVILVYVIIIIISSERVNRIMKIR
ncbi:MAG: MFS transporter, partial [Mobilitalea sp.]